MTVVKEVSALVISQHRFKNWILDALWKESSIAIGAKPKKIYLYASKSKNNLRSFNLKHSRLLQMPVLSIHQSNLELLNQMKVIDRIRTHNVLVTHFNSHQEILNIVNFARVFKQLRLLTMNSDTKSQLSQAGVPQHFIRCVFGAVNRNIFSPTLEISSSSYVLIAGDCKPRKNPETITKVIAANPDLTFVFENRKWKNYLDNQKIQLRNATYWNPKLQDVGNLYGKASALLSLALNEGGPITVLQALASGTPVLSTKVGFVPEIVDQDSGIVLEQKNDIDSISDKLRIVISMKKKTNGKDLLHGRYSWEELGKNLFTFDF